MRTGSLRENPSARTAKERDSLSAPSQVLLERGELYGRVLDFGCGRGDLKKFLDGDICQWDPFWSPDRPIGQFDVVVCNYVLNVIPFPEHRNVLVDAMNFVRPGGKLFVTVRRDLEKQGKTKSGTEQYNVELTMDTFFHKKGKYEIYTWKKQEKRKEER